MPVSREPIFHDRQMVIVEGPITTTSTTFVDIPGAELTTFDLSQFGRYNTDVSMSIQQTNNNSSIEIRAMVNGTPTASRSISFGPNASGVPQTVTFIAQTENVEVGTIVKIQWKVSVGTGQINDLEMRFDGIPENRIIDP